MLDAPSIVKGFAALDHSQLLLDCRKHRNHRAVGGLWGASAALVMAMLHQQSKDSMLVITADDDESDSLAADLACFMGSESAPSILLPCQHHDVDDQPDALDRAARLKALQHLAEQKRFLLIASLQALLQPVPGKKQLQRNRLDLAVNQALDHDKLCQIAQRAGYHQVPVVLSPGEYSLRGDILDIYPNTADAAYRLEFFDGKLESLRSMDPASQSSLQVLQELSLTLGSEDEQNEVVEHLLAKNLLILQYEPLRLEERQLQLMSPGDPMSKALQRLREATEPLASLDLSALPSNDLDYKILSAGSAAGSGESDPMGRLRSIRGMQGSVGLFCRSQAEQKRLTEIFQHRNIDLQAERVQLLPGNLSRGFRIPGLQLTLLSNTEFMGVPKPAPVREAHAVPTKAVASFFELGPGDIVVHAVHGLARFVGMELVKRGNAAEDHLRLQFRDEVQLLVPAAKVHLVQKYVGAGDSNPKLDKLGGKGFARRKAEVEQSLFDMASDLLDLQAERQQSKRPAYPRDPLEEEFLDSFPFTDTDDQHKSWQEIRADLEADSPMDRLLCGDVGFGKTELAMRAAFKVAITGRQVAILAPTTVLAEQHGRTFDERFAPHGLQVEVISRFRSATSRRDILKRSILGQVDVLIGTHRLLSEDVKFRDMGLLIVDEEQRFGVRHKEHLKSMRRQVDVLTLSATPIPRTLHSSLVGIRNISTLTQAPAGRQNVETRMAFYEQRLVQQAIQQELSRQGQVFYLHNRVSSIDAVAKRLQELAPQAKVAVGHGKMTETQMEKTLRSFIQGKADVLVCTTIIENGLDISRANTILIEDADRFGLAELHQLRGRVGRSSRQAHCYLLLDRHRPIGDAARRRLKAVEEFASLGAGFAIAMKDLEIRGAGNLLGPQQSGHIAAVGYEMYCQLLRTVMETSQDPKITRHQVQEVDVDLSLQAYIPESLLSHTKQRLELLREMDAAQTPKQAEVIAQSLRDRFGKLPQPMHNLLAMFLLKHQLLEHGVLGLQWIEDNRLVLRHPSGQPPGGAWLEAFASVRLVEAGKTHLLLDQSHGLSWDGEKILSFLLRTLLGENAMLSLQQSWEKPAKA